MNKVFLIGHIGKEPEIINTQGGSTIAKFSIATNESYKNKQGEKVEQTEWHNIVTFGKQAEIVEKYFTKGSKIMVEGKLKTDSYEGNDGVKRYTTNIVMSSFEFISGKSGSNNTATNSHDSDDEHEDLPF